MKSFSAIIQKIGINPYVLLPPAILKYLFTASGKDKGAIPVSLFIHQQKFVQNLVKYSGEWRLYLNTPMRKAAGKNVGDVISIKIGFDASDRTVAMHPSFKAALEQHKTAKDCFYNLPPGRQKEILRYLNNLKTEASLHKNIQRALNFLNGKAHFIGREKP